MFVEFSSRYCGHFPGARVKMDDPQAARLIVRGVCFEVDALEAPKKTTTKKKTKKADDADSINEVSND